MDKTQMISALERATGLKARRHDKWDNQFYFTVGGQVLWVGCYAEYEITADHAGKSGTRVPCSLVEAAAYVKSAGEVFPGGRGTVSGGFRKSESQRVLNASVSIFDQVQAMLGAPAPVAAPIAALVAPVVETAAMKIARLKEAVAAKKAAEAAAAATAEEAAIIAALEAELAE